jgi:hypothetical protein
LRIGFPVNIPLEKEDDEHPELDAGDGVLIDINDPSLTEEVLHENAEADAYAERATLKVTSDLHGSPCISILKAT